MFMTLKSPAGACLEPPHTCGIGMYILDSYLSSSLCTVLVLELRLESQCQFASSAVHSMHLILTFHYIILKFYFLVFKVQNCWPVSAVVAKRGMIVVLWMKIHLNQISKILEPSFKDWLIV